MFLADLAVYAGNWNGPAVSATVGVVLATIGVAATAAAGFFGWTLVQDFHVGVRLAPEQEIAERAIQHTPLRHRRAA